ncbi:SGNH/GDSL hydrolase family protein [Staphylococcus saprophyticus]|uniref:SGNH/GDSL hydrolase family protein n=1 Tax=Staphylococcus saprophyticus TaxID=29385 RepID=UPI001642D09B|nr:SGNH/GDSL hydrolase family protein [Staphylococcus saprophyticus]
MTIYKNKDITTNIESEKLSINNSNTSFYTEDKGSAALRIFIKYRDGAFNLNDTNLTPVLDLFHNDGSIWLDEPLEVIMSDKGLLQYNIPNNVIEHAGKVKAKLFLRNAEQSVHVANFTFDIKDSGIESAVEKEISVNIVDDAVRRIVKENAIEILGDDFEQRLNTDIVKHLDSNPELFKGEKGEPFTYDDFTKEQLDSLKINNNENVVIKSPLEGLTGVFIGDSITEVNARTRKNYHQFIADRNNMININLGHSGTGFQDRYNSVSEIKEQPDFVAVKMGTNDYGLVGGKTRPLGTSENLEMNSVARLIYYTFLQISLKYPTTPVAILTPLPRKESNPFNETKNNAGYTLGELVDVLTKIAHKFSYPVLDLYNESNLRIWNDNVNGMFFSSDESDPSKADGLHPNYRGHELISYQIESFLKDKVITGEKFKFSPNIDTSLKIIDSDKKVYSKTVNTYGIFWKKDQSMIINISNDEVDLTNMKVLRIDHKDKKILNASGITSNSPYFYTLPDYEDKDSGFNRVTQVTDFSSSFELMDNYTNRGDIYMPDYITVYYTDIKNGNIVGDTNSKGFIDTSAQNTIPPNQPGTDTEKEKVIYTTNSDGTYNLSIPKEAITKVSWAKDQSLMFNINHDYTKDIDFGNSYVYDMEINGKKISINSAEVKYNAKTTGDYFYYLTVPTYPDNTKNNRTSQVQEIADTLTQKNIESDNKIVYESVPIKLILKKI